MKTSVLDSSMLSLLNVLSSPDFKPTVELEKSLADKFCRKLNEAVKDEFGRDSLALFHEYLDCVLAVTEKDVKFIALYFGRKEFSFYDEITKLFSKF